MDLDFNEGMMLLPITAEHTIDERSPLWGHSHDSLQVPCPPPPPPHIHTEKPPTPPAVTPPGVLLRALLLPEPSLFLCQRLSVARQVHASWCWQYFVHNSKGVQTKVLGADRTLSECQAIAVHHFHSTSERSRMACLMGLPGLSSCTVLRTHGWRVSATASHRAHS